MIFEELIKSYHGQALTQSTVQFWFSVVAATAGFMLIIFMVITSNSADGLNIFLRVLPGAVIDAVAALFFRQASETRKRATELFDRLRVDKQVSKSIIISETIDNQALKSAVRAQIALHMSGIKCTSEEIKQLLAVDNTNSKIS